MPIIGKFFEYRIFKMLDGYIPPVNQLNKLRAGAGMIA